MSWNHRILARESVHGVYYQMHEVYYTNDIPDGYTALPVAITGETVADIEWTLERMKEALKKPILSMDNFPLEWNPQEKM